MSSDPLLDKMDALLKRHRGETEPPPAPAAEQPAEAEIAEPPPLPADAWLPVLTDVLAMGEPAATPSSPDTSTMQATSGEPASAEVAEPKLEGISPDVLAAQIMSELEPRLGSVLRDRLAMEIRNSLDDTLSALLAQLDVHIREIVRETIDEQLSKP